MSSAKWRPFCFSLNVLNYDLTGSDNSLWPVRHQASIWINSGVLSIGLLIFNEILIEIPTFT